MEIGVKEQSVSVFDKGKVSTAFCSPHRKIKLANGEEILDTITVQWHRARTSLALGTNCNFIQLFEDGKEVGVARDSAARRCLAHNPQPKYLFFLDDDVLPMWDAYVKLLYRLETHPEFDVAAGVYTVKGWHDPLIYQDEGCGPYWDWALGDLLTTQQHGIKATHMGLTLIRVELFQRMLDKGIVNDDVPFFKTIKEAGGGWTRSGTEDLYFYRLAREVGCNIIVDTSVMAGHIDKNTGCTWGLPNDSPPVQRAKWLNGKDREEIEEICPACKGEDYGCGKKCSVCKGLFVVKSPVKLALDIGAGGRRREWPGHKTYTTDIRADAKPDYVQDTLLLNLPADHFDLVASSHHLEHIGRFDQETVWAQIFKVCKPGGVIEHIVPSVEWAAAKIADGCVDEHVMNVLYGAQEEHGYERQFNLHYFGYTKAIAQALAEQAGFVDVRCEDWSDKPELGYNLVIRGRKPEAAEATIELPIAEPVGNDEKAETLACVA